MKKMMSLLLCAALVISTVVPALAADNRSKELETAILKVKSIVNIPVELTEFKYEVSENEGEKSQLTFWLSWHDKEYNRNINATVNGDYMTSYYTYNNRNDGEAKGLGTVTREMASVIAENFLKANNPTLAAKMELSDQGGSDAYGHEFMYIMEEAGIPVNFVTANITVDNHTGEITSYNWNSADFNKSLPSATGLISEKSAAAYYLSSGGLEIEYRSWYDYEKRELNVFPAYVIAKPYNGIDAKTGKPVQLFNAGIRYSNAARGAMPEAASADMGVSLSEEELRAVNGAANLLSSSQAHSKAAAIFPELSKMKLTHSYLNSRYDDEKAFTWSIDYENEAGDYAYTSVDAASGEVLSWSRYHDNDSAVNRSGKQPISSSRGLDIATELLKKTIPDKFKQAELNENNSNYGYVPLLEEYTSPYSYNFVRKVGGYNFASDNISVSVDAFTGEIISYNCTWHNNARFPAVNNPISASSAFEIFDEYADFNLAYAVIVDENDASDAKPTSTKNIVVPVSPDYGYKEALVYQWMSSVDFNINPITGAKIDYQGREYEPSRVIPYTDIDGHWAKNTINTLFENGYYVEGGLFEPKSNVTQARFFSFLLSPNMRFSNQDDLYEYLINRGILLESEKNPAATLTRYDVAKFAVRLLNYADLALYPEIFVNPYGDEISDDYKGHVAIAKALQIMKGDTAGNFNGDRELSNAESAVVVFNIAQVEVTLAGRRPVPSPIQYRASGGSSSGGGFGSTSMTMTMPATVAPAMPAAEISDEDK
ncbi:MAG: S-layer homology domain-containing protein [Clostridiales Family XIII bacterium]|nr:S-layer homology domain-containing protein [Clostridiales Family XIII bacterium]